MADERLRELERDAAAGNPRAREALTAARIRLAGGRDPRRDPAIGDEVYVLPGFARGGFVGRKVVTHEGLLRVFVDMRFSAAPPSVPWGMSTMFWRCRENLCDGYVHWVRTGGKGQRCGLVLLRSWRSWARNGAVEVATRG